MKTQTVQQNSYDADFDLTPISTGHDLRLHRTVVDLNGAQSVAFCPLHEPDKIIYAEGTTVELTHLLKAHGFNVIEFS